MHAPERATIDRRLGSLESQRSFLMRQGEHVGADRQSRQAFDRLARTFNDRMRRHGRTDLIIPLLDQ